jgi:hypothetical protein
MENLGKDSVDVSQKEKTPSNNPENSFSSKLSSFFSSKSEKSDDEEPSTGIISAPKTSLPASTLADTSTSTSTSASASASTNINPVGSLFRWLWFIIFIVFLCFVFGVYYYYKRHEVLINHIFSILTDSFTAFTTTFKTEAAEAESTNPTPSTSYSSPTTSSSSPSPSKNDTSNSELNNSLNQPAKPSKEDSKYEPDDSYSAIQASKTANKSGWCYIGEDRGFRGCIKVGENDKCMSGDIFPTQEICVNPNLR